MATEGDSSHPPGTKSKATANLALESDHIATSSTKYNKTHAFDHDD